MNKWFSIICFTALSFGSIAQTVVIDFEAAPNPAPISEDGFTVNVAAPNAVFEGGMFPVSVGNGTNIFGWCVNDCEGLQAVNISEDSAAAFSLVSVDSTNLVTGSIQAGQTIDIVGNVAGGGTVTQSFVLIPDTYTTFTLNSDFTNLTSVDISSDPNSCPDGLCDIGIDNITVTLGPVAPPVSVPTLSNISLLLMLLIFIFMATRWLKQTEV